MKKVNNADKRIRAAFGSMPYGAMAHFHFPGKAFTPSVIADNLEKLATVLRSIATRNQKDENDLRDLRSQHQAIRDFLKGVIQ